MAFTIRPFTPADTKAFLEVHHAAIRGIEASQYSASILNAWAPPIDPGLIERVRADETGIRILAVKGGQIVGIGELVPDNAELRACYVSPQHGGEGVGRALVMEMEAIARAKGVTTLRLDSSLNAEPFYRRLGYRMLERGAHRLGSGETMACVKMSKDL